MKTIAILAVSTIAATLSFNVLAESEAGGGTKINKSIIVNESYNKDNATIAEGKNNLSSTGSINIKNAKINKSEIINKTRNKGNSTISVGEGNTATTGSVTIE